jgi:branched-chain amino acid transport system ATP-binding protein
MSTASTDDARMAHLPTALRTGLSASQISLSFGGVKALDAVDIDLPRGTWTGLIGPNGSGKTTLLNVLSGVYVPSAGTVLLGGRDVSALRPGKLSRAGIVRTFQHPQLAESLTVWENVLLGADLRRRRGIQRESHSDRLARGREAMETFNCEQYADHLPAQVPYGIRKAAELARAVLAQPVVLLLDEPAAGLSREERQELVAALRHTQVSAPDLAVCLVEHDVRLVAAACSVIQVLNFGRVLAKGTSEQVLRDPAVKEAYLGKSTHLKQPGTAS